MVNLSLVGIVNISQFTIVNPWMKLPDTTFMSGKCFVPVSGLHKHKLWLTLTPPCFHFRAPVRIVGTNRLQAYNVRLIQMVREFPFTHLTNSRGDQLPPSCMSIIVLFKCLSALQASFSITECCLTFLAICYLLVASCSGSSHQFLGNLKHIREQHLQKDSIEA